MNFSIFSLCSGKIIAGMKTFFRFFCYRKSAIFYFWRRPAMTPYARAESLHSRAARPAFCQRRMAFMEAIVHCLKNYMR